MSSGYQKILVPIDNSEHADWAMELGIGLARRFGSCLVGSHVYTAGLRDARFRQMERDLPARYQQEGELQRQWRSTTPWSPGARSSLPQS